MAKNILIKIEYDGSAFRGWQAQRVGGAAGDGGAARDGAAVGSTGGADSGERVRTVQGTLERALSHVCGEDIVLNGTSRTDAGVHALGQAASFAGGFGIPAERIPIAVNNLLDDVRLLSAEEVPGDFHARFDAKGKTYCYRIISPCARTADSSSFPPDIFLRKYRYLLNETLDEGKMELAAKSLVGTHDFAAFRTKGGAGHDDTVRSIASIDVAGRGARDTKGNPVRETEIRVTGRSFMYNMVRIIAGTLVEVGLGAMEPGDVVGILDSRDRSAAGHTAPASGLYLEEVYF